MGASDVVMRLKLRLIAMPEGSGLPLCPAR